MTEKIIGLHASLFDDDSGAPITHFVIAQYTIRNMQAADGHFYYRLYRLYAHKTSYLRWSNAEMFVALTLLTGSR